MLILVGFFGGFLPSLDGCKMAPRTSPAAGVALIGRSMTIFGNAAACGAARSVACWAPNSAAGGSHCAAQARTHPSTWGWCVNTCYAGVLQLLSKSGGCQWLACESRRPACRMACSRGSSRLSCSCDALCVALKVHASCRIFIYVMVGSDLTRVGT